MADIGTIPESTTNYTELRAAADEIIGYASFASAKELLDVTNIALTQLNKSGISAESSAICELLLGNTESIPLSDKLNTELNQIYATAKAANQAPGLVYSYQYPYITKYPNESLLKSKVASLLYHDANTKVDYSSVLSDISALFCGLVPPVELSLCVPYFDVKIIYPKERTGYSKLSSLRFAGASVETDASAVSPQQVGLETKLGYDVAGMEIFCTPQTLTAPSGFVRDGEQTKERGLQILDPLVPLLTLESANIQQVGVGGSLYAQNKVDLKMVLHDRSRLSDIEPLTSPEVFPSVTFRITYGWSHPDNNKISGNIYGKLINAMRISQDFSLYSVSLSTRDSTSLSLSVSLISQGSQVNKGAKSLTGLDAFVPYNVIQTLIKQFARIKTSTSSTGTEIQTWSSVGSTIVTSTSAAASSNKFVSIPDYYALYSAIDEIIEQNSVLDQTKLSQISSALNVFESNVYNIPTGSFQELFIFKNKDSKNTYGNLEDPVFYRTPFNKDTKFIPDWLAAKVSSVATSAGLESSEQTEKPNVIPLSALIYRFVAKPLLATLPDLDEVRIHCFSFNSACGYMADENIGNFPIAISDLVNFTSEKKVESKFTIRTSAESALNLLLQQVNNPASPFYGHSTEMHNQSAAVETAQKSIADGSKPVEEVEADLNTAVEKSKEAIDTKNASILSEKQTAGYKLDLVDRAFVPPRIKSQIDVLPAYGKPGTNDSKTRPAGKIARIILYDERCGGFNKLGNLIFSMINTNGIARLSANSTTIESSLAGTSVADSVSKLFTSIQSTEVVTSTNGDSSGEKLYNYGIKSKVLARQVASTLYPVLNVGTEGTCITNATYNSQPAGDVGSSYFLTAIQGGAAGSVSGKSVNAELLDDVMIIPSAITLNMLGNTCITRGQTYYVDFNTGTTLDNSYTVQSVTHSISPGSFKTTVTLGPTNSATMRSLSRQIQELVIKIKSNAGISTNPTDPAISVNTTGQTSAVA